MNLPHRINLMTELGKYILADTPEWQAAKEKAAQENAWFIPDFTRLATSQIATAFLNEENLRPWAEGYIKAPEPANRKQTGLIMAGNIPLVGFHDLLCIFISGHKALVKASSKDQVLIRHLVDVLIRLDPAVAGMIAFSDRLNGCDAYIATGSNNSSRYFEYYFKKYPHIIRRNRSSAAILNGEETTADLEKLSDDVHQYFGLGCRNVTKLYVPRDYDFVPLLEAFKGYAYFAEISRYRNNYDYNLALHLLNNQFYMTNGSILLVENSSIFSAISQLHYEFYDDANTLIQQLTVNPDIQCITSKSGQIPFGQAQCPALGDYADGVDTMQFLVHL
jgi:hypothetical protein